MNLHDNIAILKEQIKKNNENKGEEVIETQDATKALINGYYMALQTREDYFLFFASLNLLNAYTKKDYAIPSVKDNYDFKGEVTKGIESIIVWKPSGITCYYDKHVTMVEIEGLQFSFHSVEITKLMEDAKQGITQLKWDGVRLQPSASLVFRFASSLEGLSNQTILNEKLNNLYEEMNFDSLFPKETSE
jgi:hypothetical protein